jgi:hypothetical protein
LIGVVSTYLGTTAVEEECVAETASERHQRSVGHFREERVEGLQEVGTLNLTVDAVNELVAEARQELEHPFLIGP